MLRWLRDRPADAEWLEPRERDWLTAELARDGQGAAHHAGIGRVLANPTVWLFGFAYFGLHHRPLRLQLLAAADRQGLGNLSNVEVGLVLMVPSALPGVAMVPGACTPIAAASGAGTSPPPALLAAVALAASAMLQGTRSWHSSS